VREERKGMAGLFVRIPNIKVISDKTTLLNPAYVLTRGSCEWPHHQILCASGAGDRM
jgi:hypothetical protein